MTSASRGRWSSTTARTTFGRGLQDRVHDARRTRRSDDRSTTTKVRSHATRCGRGPSGRTSPMSSSGQGLRGRAGAALRVAMAATGHAATPLISWDGLLDGDGSNQGKLHPARRRECRRHVRLACLRAARRRADSSTATPRRTSCSRTSTRAAAHACTEVIITALRAIADDRRERRRTAGGRPRAGDGPAPRYETASAGRLRRGNGDALQQFVSFYRVEPGRTAGKGDWVMTKQQDFGPSR